MVRIAARGTGTEPGKVRRRVALSAAITALGGLLFGYDTGVVSGALLFLKNDFGGLSSFQQELVTSLLLVGAMVGALGAGRVADPSAGGRPFCSPRSSSSSACCWRRSRRRTGRSSLRVSSSDWPSDPHL